MSSIFFFFLVRNNRLQKKGGDEIINWISSIVFHTENNLWNKPLIAWNPKTSVEDMLSIYWFNTKWLSVWSTYLTTRLNNELLILNSLTSKDPVPVLGQSLFAMTIGLASLKGTSLSSIFTAGCFLSDNLYGYYSFYMALAFCTSSPSLYIEQIKIDFDKSTSLCRSMRF